jgi:hypothetical protein
LWPNTTHKAHQNRHESKPRTRPPSADEVRVI